MGSITTLKDVVPDLRLPRSIALFVPSFGLIALGYLVGLPSGYAGNLVGDLFLTSSAGVATFLCLRTGRRLGHTGWPWLLLGWGCFAWFSGQLVWDWYQLGPARTAPYPSLADVGFLLFCPLCFAGIVGIIRPGRLRLSLDLVLDMVLVVTVVAAFDYQLLLAPLREGAAGADAASLVSMASQVGKLALALLALIAFLWSPVLRSQPAIFIVMGGLVSFAVANLIYGRLMLTSSYEIGHPVDLGWIAGFLLFGVAALMAEHPRGGLTPTVHGGEWRTSVVSRLVVIVLSVLGVSALAAYGALSSDVMPVSALAIGVAGITIAIRLANDIVDRKRTEERLAVIRDQALEASRLKSEFLAMMSHEIRTPMNGVLGMLELVLDTGLTRQQREYASTARESADGLLTILNDILDFSRIEAGKMLLEIVDLEPVSVVEGAAEVLAGRAHARNLSLTTYVAPEIPAQLRGDPTRVRQVLINLIGNAVKFTHEGEVTVRATLENITYDHVTVRFTVCDTGIGLSEEAQTRLFQSFSQADASTTRRYGGTGLGLAISKRLVELMGGEAGVSSEAGRGSTFWFTARFEYLPQTSETNPAETLTAINGLRVLIAGDRTTSREIIHDYIDSWGMRSDMADSGLAALDQLRQAVAQGDPYDVAIMDSLMLGSDETGVAGAVAADAGLAKTRLILVTAFDGRGQEGTAIRSGYSACLTRPIRKAQLFEAIAGVTDDAESNAESAPFDSQIVVQTTATPVPVDAGIVGNIVLLVEDNQVNQKVAKAQLEKLGYKVDVADNGRQALDAVAEHDHYGLILMDVQMPDMDGFTATKAIRTAEITNGRRISIVAMTANSMEGDRDACLAAGMDAYISKPVNRNQLRDVLAAWMPGAEQTRAESMVVQHSLPID